MYTKVVSVLSTGAATQDITFTPNSGDPSWTPKVAIIQYTRANTSLSAWQEHMSSGYGFTDGVNQRCVAIASEDNQARGDSATIQRDNALICALNPTGTIETVDCVATFNSWLTNGMRINWTDAPAANFYFHVLFLGGADIQSAAVGTLMSGTGTGDIIVNDKNFHPDIGLFLTGGSATINTPVVSGFLSLGAATSSSAQWNQGVYSLDNPVTMSTRQYYNHSNVVSTFTTSLTGLASFSSFEDTGFVLNVSDAFPANIPIFYLIIKGGSYAVGNDTEPAGTGTQTITTNKDTKAVAVFGLDIGTAATVSNGCMWSSGFGDNAINQSYFIFEDQNGVSDSIVVSNTNNVGAIYANFTANVTAISSVTDDLAALSSVSSTGFVINWSNIGQARPYRYITFGTGVILTEVSTTKTHKYNLIQQITKTKTHKYNIIQQITRTRTHKYNIVTKVTKSAVHVFNIIGKIVRTRTHKYNIIGKITQTRTHKYNILQKITQTKTHKYNILQKITQTRTHKYNIIGKVVATKTHKYDIIGKITRTRTHKYNIIGKIVASKTHKFNILQKITATKTHKFNIIGKLTTSKTHRFNIENKIVTTKTHKYNIIGKVVVTRTHKFDVIGKLVVTKTHVFNVLSSIARSATHKYDILERVTRTRTHKYNISSSIIEVVATKTHKFNIEVDTDPVSTTKTHKYNIIQKVTALKTHVFSVLNPVLEDKTHKFNIIGLVTLSRTHKFNIIGKVTVIKQHRFAILNKVTLSKTHKFNILSKVTLSKTHKYNIIGKVVTLKTHRYNMGGKVTTSKTHKYHVTGKLVELQEIGGSTHALIRLPERIQIIDIISDIRNRAVANILITPHLENIAVAHVAIEKYTHLLTAETQGHKHRIQARSGLILPPIIDTIQNTAICLIGKEIIQPQEKSLNRLKCSLRLQIPTNPYLRTSGQTLIAEKLEDVIRVASNTELESKHKHRSRSHVMIPYNVSRHRAKTSGDKLVDPEYIKRVKTLIKIIKSDALFGRG